MLLVNGARAAEALPLAECFRDAPRAVRRRKLWPSREADGEEDFTAARTSRRVCACVGCPESATGGGVLHVQEASPLPVYRHREPLRMFAGR